MYIDRPCQGHDKERLLVLEAPETETLTGKFIIVDCGKYVHCRRSSHLEDLCMISGRSLHSVVKVYDWP